MRGTWYSPDTTFPSADCYNVVIGIGVIGIGVAQWVARRSWVLILRMDGPGYVCLAFNAVLWGFSYSPNATRLFKYIMNVRLSQAIRKDRVRKGIQSKSYGKSIMLITTWCFTGCDHCVCSLYL